MNPITPKTPIIKEAIPAKTFDTMWINRLHISAPVVGQDAFIDAYLEAFSSTTGERSGNEIHVRIPGVFAAAQEVPALGAAAAAIYAGLDAYCKHKDLI